MSPKDAPGQKVKRKKLKELEVIVSEVIQETPDTVTLHLFTGNEELDYRPGHFLTIDPHQFKSLDRFTRYLEDIKGRKESPRAYSLASSPHEKLLSITVKEEAYVSGVSKYPPLLSPLLVGRMPAGSRMLVTGFTGPFTLPEDIDSRAGHLVHVCAGSGVVPNFSMIKYALANHPGLRHTLVYTNKTWSDVIYKRELTRLETEYPGLLRVVHTLTREKDVFRIGEGVRQGRMTEALLREVVFDPEDTEFFLCGPGITPYEKARARETDQVPTPRFMESALAMLEAIGVEKSRIHRESYG
ncbi:MAG: oxidoreductase [Leptospirillia bacterium]